RAFSQFPQISPTSTKTIMTAIMHENDSCAPSPGDTSPRAIALNLDESEPMTVVLSQRQKQRIPRFLPQGYPAQASGEGTQW
ncbi:MAG TPA: hypothetical protein PKD78_17195, partial [Saprospiraceae bacterium]|nr:hypothetical protein [Saprospiraceae bacterium]